MKELKFDSNYSMIELVRLLMLPLRRLQLVIIIKSENRNKHRSFFTPAGEIKVIISWRM